MAFGKVDTFGPTFRAEKSFTTRHAAEFWMIEPEMAFCDLNGYMDTAEAMTKYVIRYVLDNCPDEMAFFNQLSTRASSSALSWWQTASLAASATLTPSRS